MQCYLYIHRRKYDRSCLNSADYDRSCLGAQRSDESQAAGAQWSDDVHTRWVTKQARAATDAHAGGTGTQPR
jgi:hypothetical protein